MPNARIINGKEIASKIRRKTADQIAKMEINPSLAVILVGNDPASVLYTSLKKNACEECGINYCLYLFEETTNEEEIIKTIEWLNKDNGINAIIVQLPLPQQMNKERIISSINPEKDVDGFHPSRIKNYINGKSDKTPGLINGIALLIKSTGENLDGKTALIISKSNEFKTALKHAMEMLGTKVILKNPNEKELCDEMKKSDIIISAVGIPKWIKKENIKNGSIIIDVGITRIGEKSVGDADFKSCSQKASWITPVPGGVGPMTLAMLIKNTVDLYLKQNHIID